MNSPNANTARGSDFRPDIEGLRAIAVLAVLLYHAKLAHFHGGYVGVDVFFVVSGFLITRLVAREVAVTGTVVLSNFWARRARRILPASVLVLVVTLIAARFTLDPLTQGFVGRSALAASAFFANILFWTRGGYSQLTLPEPLLHFWSLAVEEQFYLFWPLILFGAARLSGHFRRIVTVIAVTIGAASLYSCIALTPKRQSFAFYWLPTRAWELLVGALLAVAAPRVVRSYPFARAVAAWIGLMVIVLCSLGYHDPKDGFPGALALVPVLATAAVILGGAHAEAGPQGALSNPLFQWIGKRSYAIYLWHFPLLVLVDAKWGPVSAAGRVGLLGASVVLAAVSFIAIEDPVRRARWLAVRARRSLAMGAGLVTVGLLASGVLLASTSALNAGGESAPPSLVVDSSLPSTGATAPDTGPPDTSGNTATTSNAPNSTSPGSTGSVTTATIRASGNPAALVRLATENAPLVAQAVKLNVVPSNLTPSLSQVYSDKSVVYSDGCLLGDGQTQPKECVYGSANSATTVVLFGDSHAAQWFPAFEAVAKKQGLKLVVLAKKHCPAGDVPQPDTGYTSQCSAWRTNVYERIAQLKPTLVVMSSLWYKGVSFANYQKGWERAFAAVKANAKHVVYLADTPIRKTDVPSCVSAHIRSVAQCTVTRRSAINPTRLNADRAATKHQGVDHIFPDDWLCDPKRCAVIIGNVLLYRDQTHLTTAASLFLTPYIATMIAPYIATG